MLALARQLSPRQAYQRLSLHAWRQLQDLKQDLRSLAAWWEAVKLMTPVILGIVATLSYMVHHFPAWTQRHTTPKGLAATLALTVLCSLIAGIYSLSRHDRKAGLSYWLVWVLLGMICGFLLTVCFYCIFCYS